MNKGRTSKSIRNAKFALIFYVINLALTFVSRKIFITHLGAEVLGLNTTLTNLLALLNLAELGVGVAIAYTLYQPIYENNRQIIREIINVQGYFYRKIVYIIVAISVILFAAFPWIFKKADIPMWYAYATFFVLVCSSLFGYLWNYRQILLTADQKEYKNTINRQGLTALKVLIQIVCIKYLSHGYVYWLVLEFIFAVITTIVISYVINKEYPWLKGSVHAGKELRHKYPAIFTKTKQLFVHKIGDYLTKQISPILIYAFTSLTVVAIYGNYWLIALGMFSLFAAIFNSMDASVGNLVAEGNKLKIKKVFWELFSIRFYLTTIACFTILKTATPFMKLWIGEEYLLGINSLILIVVILYIKLMRTIIDNFTNAYGLYQDVWAPVTESIINIGLSILLGKFYGLNGVLWGTLGGLILIRFLWKPVFLYKYGFHENIKEYIIQYGILILPMAVSLLLSSYIINRIWAKEVVSWLQMFFLMMLVSGVSGILSGISLFAVNRNFRCFCSRFLIPVKR